MLEFWFTTDLVMDQVLRFTKWMVNHLNCNQLEGELWKRHKRKHTAELNSKVVIEAILGIETMSDIAVEFEIQSVMVSSWKKEILENYPERFENNNAKKDKDSNVRRNNSTVTSVC